MTDLEKLKEILDNQYDKTIKTGDWDKVKGNYFECNAEYSNGKNGKRLIIEALSIGFTFTKSGRFVGIYNWKD